MSNFKFLLLLFIAGGLLGGIVLADSTGALRPIADGTDDSADWENSGKDKCDAVDCYTEINEIICDGDASYIKNKNDSASQTFDIAESSIPDGSTVTQISITICAQKKKNGAAFQTRYCLNGSCTDSGTTIEPGNNYTEYTQNHTVNFTKTSGSDIEIGITSKADKEVRVSQISTVITYTLPEEEIAPPTSSPASGTGRIIGIGPTVIRFAGRAYPGSSVRVFRKMLQEPYTSMKPEVYSLYPDGRFEMQLSAILQGEYYFGLEAEDREGNKTHLVSFPLLFTLSDGVLGINNVLMPPTFEFELQRVRKGEDLKITGYGIPNKTIEFEIDGRISREAYTNEEGKYTLSIDTSNLSLGEHQIRTKYRPTLIAPKEYSPVRIFKVSALEFPQADLNEDETVDVYDWSIFLFRTRTADETLRKTIDLDNNGTIGISDFSIFLYAFSQLK